MPDNPEDFIILPDEEPAEWDEEYLPGADEDDLADDSERARALDPVPSNKFLYIGKALTADEFTRYVQNYNFGSNPPNFIIMHHTAIPYTLAAPAPGRNLSGAWDANENGLSDAQIKQRRLRKVHNMKEYYRTRLLWDRGPHLFIDDRYIYLFTPMYDWGIHAKQGNSYTRNGKFNYSIGIEVIGHHTNVRWPKPVEDLVGHTIAVLKKKLNTFDLVYKPWAGGISGHREYNKPACPGNAVTNDYIIRVAKAGLQRLNASQTSRVSNRQPSQPTTPQKTVQMGNRSAGLNQNSPLLGRASGSQSQLAAYLKRVLPTGHEYTDSDVDLILGYYWKYATQVGIDPYLAAVQSIYETNAWRSFWAGRPRRNPANLGVVSKSIGLSFKSWDVSVQAHIGKLLALALTDQQANTTQKAMMRKNPTHMTIVDRGSVKTLRHLDGRWNNLSNYSNKLLMKAKEITG